MLKTLPDHWRARAEQLRRYAPAAATAFTEAATELEEAIREAELEELTLAEASRESGYSERRLRELVADGSIRNAGRKGAPRIRRGDLPHKPRRGRPAASLNDVSATSVLTRMKALQ